MSLPRPLVAPLLALALALSSADLELPDTRPGRVAARFVEAFNAGDGAAMHAFWEEFGAPHPDEPDRDDQRVQRFLSFQPVLGELDPQTVVDDSEHAVTLHVYADGVGEWLSLTVTLDPEPPHAIDEVRMTPAASPEVEAVDYEGWSDFDALVERFRDDLGTPAVAVAVADASGVLHAAAAGRRSLADDAAVGTDDRFHVGSITKSMTATVVGALVEEGVLRWDLPLAEALPDVEMRPVYRDVTLEMLLQHRGGINQHLTFEDDEMARLVGLPGTPTEQRAAFVAEVLMEHEMDAPGRASNYSNAGYAVAGLVAERAAGRPWEELVAEHVFGPAAMDTAGIGWPATPDRPDEPRGHFGHGADARTQGLDEYDFGSFVGPAGDVHCSAADLARYGRMHLRGMLGEDGPLRAETVQHLHAPGGLEPEGIPYACGWAVLSTPRGTPLHWHNGSAGTFYASISVMPEEQLVVAVVMNGTAPSADRLIDKLRAAVVAQRAGEG